MSHPVELTTAEKEKIIELKVQKYKEEQEKIPINKRRFCFSVTGPALTRLIRDSWASDTPIHALQKLCIEGLMQTNEEGEIVSRMSLETAVELATGKKMFIGDSRIDSLPGGIEIVDDDGRYNKEYENYSVEEMIDRLEKNYISDSNYRSGLVRILNMLKNEITNQEDPIMLGNNHHNEWMTPSEIRQKVNALDKKIKFYTDNLDFLYPLVFKTIRDLPIDQIGTEPSKVEAVIAEQLSRGGKIQKNARIQAKREYDEFERKRKEELEERKHKEDIEAHRNLVTPVTDEELKDVGSCWLLPDGTMFGGQAYAFIHDHIIYYLNETNYFKDSGIKLDRVLEDDVEKMRWCKLSGHHGFMLYESKFRDTSVYTEEQRLKIIDWMLATEREEVRINGKKIPLKHLMEMKASDMVHYGEWRESDQNPFKELNDPTYDEWSDAEIMQLVPESLRDRNMKTLKELQQERINELMTQYGTKSESKKTKKNDND